MDTRTKICDQISDTIVTDCLRNDRNSRCGIECLIKDRDILISGELSSLHHPDLERLAFDVLHSVGIRDTSQYWVTDWLGIQSPDIAQGVDTGGAGDQGMMFGYATDETPEMLPIPFAVATLALRLLRDLDSSMFLPDAKAQVSFDYETGKITTFLISTQHRSEYQVSDFCSIVETIMETAAEEYELNTDFRRLVNPTGRFVIGGSFADCGLTGRKIIADTYGGMCRHGGGALSGKDPTRSTEAVLIWRGKSQRTSSVPETPNAAKSSWRMPSAWPSQFPWAWIASAPSSDLSVKS